MSAFRPAYQRGARGCRWRRFCLEALLFSSSGWVCAFCYGFCCFEPPCRFYMKAHSRICTNGLNLSFPRPAAACKAQHTNNPSEASKQSKQHKATKQTTKQQTLAFLAPSCALSEPPPNPSDPLLSLFIHEQTLAPLSFSPFSLFVLSLSLSLCSLSLFPPPSLPIFFLNDEACCSGGGDGSSHHHGNHVQHSWWRPKPRRHL